MVYCHNAQKEMANTEESYSQYYVYVHVFRMPGVSGRGWRNLKGCSRPMLWMSNTQWAVGCLGRKGDLACNHNNHPLYTRLL